MKTDVVLKYKNGIFGIDRKFGGIMMSEPTIKDVLQAIHGMNQKIDQVEQNLNKRIIQVEQNLNERINQVEHNLTERINYVEQAVREIRNDHNEIGYIQDRLLEQDKMIWRIRKKLKMTSGECE